jgi:hypothetical protein
LKYLITVLIILCFTAFAYAGEKEDLKISYLQEHMRALQLDYQLTQEALQKAMVDKQVAEAKEKAETEKNSNDVKK